MAFPSYKPAQNIQSLPVLEPELARPIIPQHQEIYIPNYDPESEGEYGQKAGFVWGGTLGLLGAPLWAMLNLGMPAELFDWLILVPIVLGATIFTSMLCALVGQNAAQLTARERYQGKSAAPTPRRHGRVLGAILAVPVALTLAAMYMSSAMAVTHTLPVGLAMPMYIGLIISPLLLTWALMKILRPLGGLLLASLSPKQTV